MAGLVQDPKQQQILADYLNKLQNPDQQKQEVLGLLNQPPGQQPYQQKWAEQGLSPESVGMAGMGSIENVGGALESKINNVFHRDNLPSRIEMGPQHIAPVNLDNELEVAKNYRLNNADDIYYATDGKKIVGHLGLDPEGSIKGVYVDPQFRRQGYAEQMYLKAAKDMGSIKSDEFLAMEPEAKQLWEKLKKDYPDAIKKTKTNYEFDGTKIGNK